MPRPGTPDKVNKHDKDEKATFIDSSLIHIVELVYEGSYEQLIELVIKTILKAPKKDRFLKVVLNERVKGILRICDVYCVAMEMDGEKVLEFGMADGKRSKVFECSDWLGYKENYFYFTGNKVPVGYGNFEKAIAHISKTLLADTDACKNQLGTVVICICEAARFKPLFAEFKNSGWLVLLDWMWILIRNWKKFSAVAREDRQSYVAPKELNDKEIETLTKNSGWLADNISIQHRHQEFRNPSDQGSTSASREPTQGHPSLCVANVKELFAEARIRSGLSRRDLGKKLDLSEKKVSDYETGKKKSRPKREVLKKMDDMYLLKLS